MKEQQIEEMHLEFEKWDDADTELSMSEWLYNKGYRKASDIAREIFEEIDDEIKNHGITYARRKIAELKKKYTESEDNK